jgi:predicted peptidase
LAPTAPPTPTPPAPSATPLPEATPTPTRLPPTPSATPAATHTPAPTPTSTLPAGRQQAYTFEAQVTRGSEIRQVRLNYLLFLPGGYAADPQQRWPLVLFLHGLGETGSDVELVKKHGIPKIVEERRDLPFIAVSPQCPYRFCWMSEADTLNALLDEIVASYAVDDDRVYLTGLSMGGYGAWHLAIQYPDRFAAVVPIAGGGDPGQVCALKDVPVWAFHGALDDVVDPGESQEMVAALEACGGDVQFTLYSGVTHDSWTQTYDNPELYEWLLNQVRPTD